MKYLIIATMLLSLGLAQDVPRYACPEVDVDFDGFGLLAENVPNVESWEDCGKTCTASLNNQMVGND